MYNYNQKISERSDAVNNALISDVIALLGQLKTENREMSYLDRRNLANKFFIEHSISIPAVGEVKNFSILSEKDQYEIPARLYLPAKESDKLIFFIHGGGWMQGNLDTHDYLCKKLTDILGCKVLAVEYRLAPEHKFPVGLEDLYSTYKWCINDISKDVLGSVSEIYLSGDSAGGNLSAALNLLVHQVQRNQLDFAPQGNSSDDLKRSSKTGKNPLAQRILASSLRLTHAGKRITGLLLFYPALSPDTASKSFDLFGNQAALTAISNTFFIEQYIGTKIDDPEVVENELIFPINGDPALYPKTFIIAAGCDILLDGQLKLFEELKKNNILTEMLIEDGAIHGFMTYGKEFDENITKLLIKVKEWM